MSADNTLKVATPIVRLSAVTKSFQIGEVTTEVLRGIDLQIARGELAVVLGASGSGKTTLLNLLGALDRPTAGSVLIDGVELAHLDRRARTAFRRERLGFVFQFFNLIPTLDALENVELGLELLALGRAEVRARAMEYLRLVGLEGKERKLPAQLSGGEQQRVAIARALAKEARLVLADEPTGNLDAENSAQILELMQSLQARLQLTFVIATHNAAIASAADRVVHIQAGRIAPASGATDTP